MVRRVKGRWSARVVLRYALLQLPGLAVLVMVLIVLRRWVDLPGWVMVTLLALWVAKDMVLFPFVWRSYDSDHATHGGDLIGERAVALESLEYSGYVRVRGELWKAEIIKGWSAVKKGEEVQIVSVDGLTLYVRPKKKEKEELESE